MSGKATFPTPARRLTYPGQFPAQPASAPAGRDSWSIPALMLGSVALFIFFVLLSPLGQRGLTPEESGANVAAAAPLVVRTEPHAATIVGLRIGPDDSYVGVGQINRGARVEVIGRNETGSWLAVSLSPGSSSYAWAPASSIGGAIDIPSLPLTPVKYLP